MHLFVAKIILRYMAGTRDFDILYKTNEKSNLLYYRDSECVEYYDDTNITSIYTFMFRSDAI